MKQFKGYLSEQEELLIESSTADATNAEMAICVAYNMMWGEETKDDEDAAATKAGVLEKRKKWIDLLSVGKEVATDSGGNWGKYLSHAGSNDESTNYYKSTFKLSATDTTSKSDFVSITDDNWNISLKKAGDNGPGAQIMSSKAGEAQGVFKAGIGHYESVKSTTISSTTKKALDQLWSDMSDSADNKLVIQVSGGKKDFANWYKQANHSRRKELATFSGKPSPSKKQIDTHLDAEMDLLGLPSLARNPQKKKEKLLYNLKDRKGNNLFTEPKGFKKLESTKDALKLTSYEVEYKKDKNWTVGIGYTIDKKGTAVQTKSGRTGTSAVVVNPEHLENIDKSLLSNDNLKNLITDVAETSMATKTWAEDLEKFYKGNDELKKWFLYEAGSGLFKFTGSYSNGKPYKSAMSPVANKIVVFDKNGLAKEPITILQWAKDHTSALSEGNVQISYKTSGTSGYAAIRLAAHYESELPMLQEEITRLKAQYMLNEGVFSWVKDKVSVFLNKIKNVVKTFVENVIKKFINGLKILAEKGHHLFMEAMGIEGSVTIPVPSW